MHKAFVGLTQPAGEGAHSLAFADTGRAAVARKGCDEQLGQECLQAAQPHHEEDGCLHVSLKHRPVQHWAVEGSIG